jgi:hypothetical protein
MMGRGRAWVWVRGLAVAGVATSASAQTLGLQPEPAMPWWRVIGALIICLLLALGAAIALRSRLAPGGTLPLGLRLPRFTVLEGLAGRAPKRLQLVETLRLSHQIDVCLLECDGASMIIAATPQGAIVVRAPAPADLQADARDA